MLLTSYPKFPSPTGIFIFQKMTIILILKFIIFAIFLKIKLSAIFKLQNL